MHPIASRPYGYVMPGIKKGFPNKGKTLVPIEHGLKGDCLLFLHELFGELFTIAGVVQDVHTIRHKGGG
jgi:hypothetical protein